MAINGATTAMTTDYMEKSFAGFPRSYPDGMEDDDVDALAYSPAGFIWDNAIAHGKTLRDYGEFAITDKRWIGSRKERQNPSSSIIGGTGLMPSPELLVSSRPGVESLRPYLCTNTVGWDMDIPDVFRAAQFIKELREYRTPGELSQPGDHLPAERPHFRHQRRRADPGGPGGR